MKRNLKLEGIIIRNYRIQDYHKGAVIFTPEKGIIHATAFGGYKGKSKLGPAVQPLTFGFLDIYQDPVKKSNKIIEYDIYNIYENIKADLKKYFTALSWLEIVVKSHAGGEAGEEFFLLLKESLESLDTITDVYTDRVAVQFLIRAIVLLGGNLDPYECSQCGRSISIDENLYYSKKENTFICGNCGGLENRKLNGGLKKYIEYSIKNSLDLSLKAGIDNDLLKYLKSLLYIIIQEYLEDSLLTLKTGKEYIA